MVSLSSCFPSLLCLILIFFVLNTASSAYGIKYISTGNTFLVYLLAILGSSIFIFIDTKQNLLVSSRANYLRNMLQLFVRENLKFKYLSQRFWLSSQFYNKKEKLSFVLLASLLVFFILTSRWWTGFLWLSMQLLLRLNTGMQNQRYV